MDHPLPNGVDYFGVARRTWPRGEALSVSERAVPALPIRPDGPLESAGRAASPYPTPAYISRARESLLLPLIELFAYTGLSAPSQALARSRKAVGMTPVPPPPIEKLRSELRAERVFAPADASFHRSAMGSAPPGVSLTPVVRPPAETGRRHRAPGSRPGDDDD